ncbi:hypothetical protein ACFSJU_18600 [Paradesertivirga mongoliensis]|uniref:Uncharacterized protein n=1 Tax=Paradesertivirga mongoliensis TaxID=2100740 RepID=A0ABW4ZSB1_9SPHI|nr:hypothetical protein [Pedobacter mongoliensis]
MKKIIITAFIAGLSVFAFDSSAQTGTDEQGTYRYETREERVWIPEQRTGGIFGVGGRTIPGHYETRTRQVKVYDNERQNGQYGEGSKGWEGKHPHGMPPGQRKKQGNRDNDRDRRYDRNNDGVIDERDRNYDRNNDGVVDARDRVYDRNNDGVIDSRDRSYKRDGDDDDDRERKNNKKSKPGNKGKSKNK